MDKTEVPEEVRKYMSMLGKRSAIANRGKRDYSAMAQKANMKRWGYKKGRRPNRNGQNHKPSRP